MVQKPAFSNIITKGDVRNIETKQKDMIQEKPNFQIIFPLYPRKLQNTDGHNIFHISYSEEAGTFLSFTVEK